MLVASSACNLRRGLYLLLWKLSTGGRRDRPFINRLTMSMLGRLSLIRRRLHTHTLIQVYVTGEPLYIPTG